MYLSKPNSSVSMITQIDLENWKTHGSSKISFSRGTNILIGQMGSGKSSVLDAISFALFGTFPSIQHRRVNISEIIRSRPEQKDSATVTLHFIINGDNYIVRRSISKTGGAKAVLEKNGEYVQSQPQRVNEEIMKILKVDYDLFSKAIYSEQNGLDYFLDIGPTDRKKQIDELLGLDRFALAQDNVTTMINKIKDLADENEKTASGFDIGKLKAQMEALEKEMLDLGAERRRIELELAKVSTKKEKLDNELSELKRQFQKKMKLEQEIVSSKSRIETLSREIEKMGPMDADDESELNALILRTKKDAENAKHEQRDLQERWQREQARLSNLNASLNASMKDKAEHDRLIDEQKKLDRKTLESNRLKISKSLEVHQNDLARNAALIGESSKWAKELEKHIQKCPVCERDLDESMRQRLLADKEGSIRSMEREIREISAIIVKEKAEQENNSALLNRLSVIEDKIKSYGDVESAISNFKALAKAAQDNANNLSSLMAASAEALTKKNEELIRLTKKKDDFERRSRYLEQRSEEKKSMEEKERNSAAIKIDQTKLDSIQEDLTHLVSEFSKLSTTVESYRKYESDKKIQIRDKGIEIDKVDALYKDITRKREITENLARFKVSLQETQTVLRTKLIDSINNVMQEVWPDIYPYGDYSSIMMKATAEDYVLKVKTHSTGADSWQDVGTIASGGERSISCLALRIAFSLVLSPTLRWLILDEPTHNIDQQGLERFIRMFNEVLPRIVDQTFIITHDPILKQAYNSKVYMLSRNKNEDRETVVEEV